MKRTLLSTGLVAAVLLSAGFAASAAENYDPGAVLIENSIILSATVDPGTCLGTAGCECGSCGAEANLAHVQTLPDIDGDVPVNIAGVKKVLMPGVLAGLPKLFQADTTSDGPVVITNLLRQTGLETATHIDTIVAPPMIHLASGYGKWIRDVEKRFGTDGHKLALMGDGGTAYGDQPLMTDVERVYVPPLITGGDKVTASTEPMIRAMDLAMFDGGGAKVHLPSADVDTTI